MSSPIPSFEPPAGDPEIDVAAPSSSETARSPSGRGRRIGGAVLVGAATAAAGFALGSAISDHDGGHDRSVVQQSAADAGTQSQASAGDSRGVPANMTPPGGAFQPGNGRPGYPRTGQQDGQMGGQGMPSSHGS